MQKCAAKYDNFIMEKNEASLNFKSIKDPVEKEEISIWIFMNQIMNKVEIV